MPELSTLGIQTPFLLGTEQTTVLAPYLREIFIAEAPLFSRLPHVMAPSELYQIIVYDVRPRTYTLAAAVAATTANTTMTLVDSSPLMVGDILKFLATGGASYEYVEVIADPNTAANTVSVRRQAGGTTDIANDGTGNLTVTLVGNSRTGGEIMQTGHRALRSLIPQAVQTSMYPVEIGGKTEAVRNIALPPGMSSVFSMEQATKATEMIRDTEYTFYHGQYEAPSTTNSRAKSSGLRQLINNYQSGANVKTAAGSSYTLLNLITDGPQKAIDGGGDPDVLLASTGFMSGLATWGFKFQMVTDPLRTGTLGVPYYEVAVPFISGKTLKVIPSYQLFRGSGTNGAVVLTSTDLKVRYIREAQFKSRGSLGDAYQGDWIGDYCVELGHPGWHAWVEGISSFA